MTWETMAGRLFGGPADSSMREQLRREEAARSQLISELSDIGKRRGAPVSTDLRSVWLRTLDHVFIVMNLLKSRGAA